MFSSLPALGQVLLLSDELASPADFMLHNLLSAQLKRGKNADINVVVLSVLEGAFERWNTLAAKSNLNLSTHSYTFINVVESVITGTGPTPLDPSSANLRPVLELLAAALEASTHQDTLVILDDISTLQWIGFTSIELSRFARALRNLCLKANAAFVVRHHIVSRGNPDELFRELLQLCTYHMDVRPLASGRSGSVSGEIALHAGPLAGTDKRHPQVPFIKLSCAVQYRLTDTGAVFFERGTGAGVH